MDDEPGKVSLPTVFIGAEEQPIVFANQFVIQNHEDEFVLTLAQLSPPYLLGTEEEMLEQAKNLAYVPIKVVGRFSLNRQRVGELIAILQDNVAKFDERQRS